ncbi:D-alanyl-D-alanine carboxypeptidase, penicillin-binding protein 5 [Alishewanella aestuarii B11]|uniref:serine-type D-Ala-D-Ala carboxypeptidase n=1 Tax=Alishewanella aestuarii B11 TaxID=1197174 RepID=J1QIA8_9ALTE|nr:D-alanyl-D-alanine carboxypeptidase family protein [Alishewanella aestuarii]EJI85271.1 D-alanyl-D-alanine carboxypeptidase, penicillin-binding protein 5 [Alishewanella aestuarii B11]
MNSYYQVFGAATLAVSSAFLVAQASAQSVIPQAPQVAAKGHILVDYDTGAVLSEENADMSLAPASLTKMMTIYVIGMELKQGNITMDDMVTVSERAWSRNFPGSSLMFIEVGAQVKVADLARGIMIQSGNDACVAMAEHIAGTESAFVDLMNAHAERLGMVNTRFGNSHGLHLDEQYTTPRDMAVLSRALIRDVPDLYALYSERQFTFNNITQHNRNSLLWDRSLEVDGIKTGYTKEAGFSLITSATREGMRLVSVVMGTANERARAAENKKLLTYGFRFFETVTTHQAGEKLADERLWKGQQSTVAVGLAENATVTLQRGQRRNLKADIQLDQQLIAPINKGDVVGKVVLQLNNEQLGSYPLVALESIEQAGFFSRLVDAVKLKFQ